MPITFYPSTQELAPVSQSGCIPLDPSTLLQRAYSRNETIIQSSFQSSFFHPASDSNSNSSINSITVDGLSSTSSTPSPAVAAVDLKTPHPESIRPAKNGLVDACIEAYNNHHHLVLRPDDIWIAILAQFGLYIDAESERFREYFVSHQGQKNLVVKSGGNRFTVDFGRLARQMTDLIGEHIKDPNVANWMRPDFSTTTETDQVVAAVIVMATFRTYFTYEFYLCCGLPAVTLEGDRSDWVRLVEKIERFRCSFNNDHHLATWYGLLKPDLTRFVASFDQPDSEANKEFWQSIAHYRAGGSTDPTISGWITAFCFFDKKGKPFEFDSPRARARAAYTRQKDPVLVLDGVSYPTIGMTDIPPAYAEVDVKLDDNGEILQTTMIAGLVGSRVVSSKTTTTTVGRRENHDDDDGAGQNDTLQPLPGWWILEKGTNDDGAKDSSRNAGLRRMMGGW